MIYVFKGEVFVQTDTAKLNLIPGEALLISPLVVHSFDIPKESKAWVGVFSEDHVADFAKKHKNIQFSPFKIDRELVPFLEKELFIAGSPRHYFRLGLIYLICDQCENNATQLSDLETKSFRNTVLDSISKSFQGEISMKDLATSLGYEYHYFSQLFHMHFRMNFKDFINIFRYERARHLLSKKELNITEVYEKCGFSSLRNFNRVFKEMSGITPHKYRQSLKL
jgi:AraC-like DNA-binding protein